VTPTPETAAAAVAAAIAEPRPDARADRVAAWTATDRIGELHAALRSALADPRADARRRVLLLCSALPGADALRAELLAALADPVWGVREAAVVACGSLPDPEGDGHARLVGLTLHDPCPLVRRAAAAAAGPRIDPEGDYGPPIRHRFERQRIRAADALGFVVGARAAGAVELLAGAAADPHPKVRAAALRALAQLDPGAVLVLLPAVVRRCAEAEPAVAGAACGLWQRLVAHPSGEVFRPAFACWPDPHATRTAVEQLPVEHPLRRAWDSLPMPAEPLDAHRFARHLAGVFERVLNGPAQEESA
jgi:hypothetical protein